MNNRRINQCNIIVRNKKIVSRIIRLYTYALQVYHFLIILEENILLCGQKISGLIQ